MAVVQKYAKSYKDPGSIQLPLPAFAEGRVRAIVTGGIEITNGNSANSELFLGKVPSSAIILPQSILYHGAVTGVTDFDIGLKRDGVLVDIDALADGLTLASAGNKSVVAALATGSIGRRVWEIAGLSVDPGCEFDIVGTLKADASATALIEAFIYYAKK